MEFSLNLNFEVRQDGMYLCVKKDDPEIPSIEAVKEALNAKDAGPIVGYFCIVEDPDGNWLEFSFGQSINPRDLPPDVSRKAPA